MRMPGIERKSAATILLFIGIFGLCFGNLDHWRLLVAGVVCVTMAFALIYIIKGD